MDNPRYPEEHGASEERLERFAERRRRIGDRTALYVPLSRGSAVVGILVLVRRGEAQPFSEREIALAESFADQAVIAIENARLFEELQDRNGALQAALEQQAGTADVLRVIGANPTQLPVVVEALARTAARLCGGSAAVVGYEVDGLRTAWSTGLGHLIQTRERATPTSFAGALLTTGEPIHVVGAAADWEAAYPDAARLNRSVGWDAVAAYGAPVLRQGEAVGYVLVIRAEPRPFAAREQALIHIFADQMVIALENARLFEELQTRSRELEAASQAKSEFLSRMSHELRTPLNAVIGFAEVMEMDPLTTLKQHERVGHILRGGRHLLGLINEVLDISRIEAGRLSLSLEPVALDAVLGEVLDLIRPIAIEADVDLHVPDATPLHVAVLADKGRLRQIILNLVTNAVKYNHPGGSVTLEGRSGERGVGSGEQEGRTEQPAVSNERRDEEVNAEASSPASHSPLPAPPTFRLTVSDTGPGISADEIDRLFSPFERLSADQSGVEGTGLGLAIAKRLAQAMGGDIGVESVAGQGSEFWLDLPPASLPLGFPLEPEDETQLSVANGSARAATILYIEDNLPNVEVVQHVLGFRPGITLLTAPRAEVGLRLAGRYLPDLILLDLNLPDLQGDEALARLRADPRTAAIPVVMISADATESQIQRLLAAGARDYLTKPLDVKRFLALVDEMGAGSGERGVGEAIPGDGQQ